ncbi:MAG: YdbL family protein [Gammaproteobacteria bacterium]|jgi:uncharacterized protein
MHTILKTLTAFMLALLLATPALALDLDTAKARGLVGESSNGYIGAVQSNAEVNALVRSINSQRKSHYQEISRKNGTSLSAVEKLAGDKLIRRASPGEYVNRGSGWVKK